MKTHVFMGISDSVVFRDALTRFTAIPFDKDRLTITLVHVFRQAKDSEQLTGENCLDRQFYRFKNILNFTQDKLIENGFKQENIKVELAEKPYPTVADGLIDQFNKGQFHLVVLGRKRMSKAEEFILGDPCIKLTRCLENTCLLTIKGR